MGAAGSLQTPRGDDVAELILSRSADVCACAYGRGCVCVCLMLAYVLVCVRVCACVCVRILPRLISLDVDGTLFMNIH